LGTITATRQVRGVTRTSTRTSARTSTSATACSARAAARSCSCDDSTAAGNAETGYVFHRPLSYEVERYSRSDNRDTPYKRNVAHVDEGRKREAARGAIFVDEVGCVDGRRGDIGAIDLIGATAEISGYDIQVHPAVVNTAIGGKF